MVVVVNSAVELECEEVIVIVFVTTIVVTDGEATPIKTSVRVLEGP